jgi:hypothetical protein
VTELISKVSSGATRQARAVVATVPAPLNAICARAMATAASERYARATDLADEIERWIADEPVTAFPDSWLTRRITLCDNCQRSVGSSASVVPAGSHG